MHRLSSGWVALCFSGHLFAFPCYLTVIKQNCWKDYAVTVTMNDAVTEKKLSVAQLEADELWTRVKFECQPKQSLNFVAQFSPAVWEGEETKTYPAKRNWFLPDTITPDVLAWNIQVCFPTDFASVPLPAKMQSQCSCDASAVPKISE